MNRKMENSLEYLEKKMEPKESSGDANFVQVMEKLKKPFQEIDYPEEGEVKIEKGDLEIEIAFQPAKRFAEQDGKIDFKLKRVLYEPGEWKMIEKFVIRNKKTGGELHLLDILPKDYRIIWTASSDEESVQTADFENKICLSRGDFSQPRIVLGLLHEIGHCVDCENIEEHFDRNQYGRDNVLFDIYRNDPDQKMPAASLERMLRAERNAWSFALRKIKPFFDEETFDKKDILAYIHGRTLASYSQGMRKKMKHGLSKYDWTRSY